MVTIAVAAILLAIAYPSFTSLINSNRLTSQANELVAAMQSTRTDAIRFNRRVYICKSANQTSCSTAAGAWTGWLSYVDTDGNGTLTDASEVLRSGSINGLLSVLSSPSISDSNQQFFFGADGLAWNANGTLLRGTLSVCMATASPNENIRLVELFNGSRLGVTPANGNAACPAPANPV